MSTQQHARIRPEEEIDFEHHLLQDDGIFPNNPELPLLYYPSALLLPAHSPAAAFERLFAAHQWDESWRDGIYDFDHYHSTAHEVLGIYSGWARVQLGGEREGIGLELQEGDVLVIPAGVAHKCLQASDTLGVVGAYPRGQHFDMNYGKEAERPGADYRITAVAMPEQDPVYGSEGPLIRLWVEQEELRSEQ